MSSARCIPSSWPTTPSRTSIWVLRLQSMLCVCVCVCVCVCLHMSPLRIVWLNGMSSHLYHVAAMISILDEAVNNWIKQGGDPADLIEPVDGFHPSTTANMLTGNITHTAHLLNLRQSRADDNPAI